ncbi:MAG TPA: DNA polymerase/3'-5' exonuclease PolX [Clostridia bacterium]|nr:DNA polymerase/3'-5' exonuclease PolX [Clostridia bacterium]
MDKRDIVQILEEIALLLDLKGENPFKIKAYVNAARSIELLDGDLKSYINEGKLDDIKGVGKAITEKLTELVTTGRLEYYEELKKSIPVGLLEMLTIPGVGPKKVKVLYEKLDVKSIGELEYACIENRLLSLAGFGKKTQENILKGIMHVKTYKGQHLFGDVYQEAMAVKETLLANPITKECDLGGSLRRRKEVVKDIDIVASTTQPAKLMDYYTSLPQVEEVVSKGETKSTVRLKSGINMDLRVVDIKEFPYALNHFTGSKEHNTAIRHRAKAMGIKVNEYGLFRGEELLPCNSEEEIYRVLGLRYIPPELRENTGEIEAAEKEELPELLTRKDIKGTFHMHTVYSDGSGSIEEMVEEAIRLGFQYIGITDHSRAAYYARGLNIDEVKRQVEEIDAINQRHKNFRVFKGIESDILPDGSLDYDDEVLKLFDFVIAAVHSNFKMEKDRMTERLVNALKNRYTIMLAHPTGRILLAREEYELDINAVIDAAAEYGKVVEINADPHRLDLDWRNLKYAKEKGVKISINTDAHSIQGLSNISYGVGIARKGWLEKQDVINTMDIAEMERFLEGVKYEKHR